MGRRGGEHWAGLLWGRKISIHITRRLAPTRVTPNAVTYAMIAVGVGAAATLLLPGVLGAVLCAIGIQLYLVLDCVDGELARWRATTSRRGVYLDRLGHFVVEGAMFATYGFHVEQTWSSGWTSLMLATALILTIAKLESDLVAAVGGPHPKAFTPEGIEPQVAKVRTLRRLTHPLKIHRLSGAIEASLFMVAAAIARAAGWDHAERAAIVVFAVVAVGLVIGHAASILTSERLRDFDD